MQEYFSGKKLFGDDFSEEQILNWYKEEKEGYANLGSKEKNTYKYYYHKLNKILGFNKINASRFNKVLGFGSAWGSEFELIWEKISELVILDPSENMKSHKIGELSPIYKKPNVNGTIDFANNTFELITCFGTLHHIPNVTFVLKELIRVLKPNGYLLLREPIISMGDWRDKRNGLTKNERGIPVTVFDKTFNESSVKVVSKIHCFTITYQISKLFRFLNKPIYSYQLYIYFDIFLSWLMQWNIHYHATKKLHRIAPNSVFYVIKKNDHR